MKRFTAVRVLAQALLDCDVAIFIGEGICKEAAPYVTAGAHLMIPDTEDYLISFALGMALGTDKRVFVFCDDNYILRNISELMQAGITKTRNFFIMIFTSGEYPSVPHTPNIFASANSKHGMLYELGFVVHDYTNQFRLHKNPLSIIKQILDRTRGPLSVIIKTDCGTKKMPEVRFSGPNDILDVQKFILNKSIVGHNFVPPMGTSVAGFEE